MNQDNLKRDTIIGTIFVLITGIIAHYIYDWSGKNFIVGFFTPVNESIWEHMKLCFFPMLLYAWYINKKQKLNYSCILSALLSGILLGTFSIPILFYTYSGILGRNFLLFDIAIFFISVIYAFYIVYRLTLSCRASAYTYSLTVTVIILMICFILFTYLPPNFGIFIE